MAFIIFYDNEIYFSIMREFPNGVFDYSFFNMILWYITEANKKIIYKTANAFNTRLGIHTFILPGKTKKICFPDCDVKKGK